MSQPEQLSFPQPPVLLGVAGCSGSGKTTLARELATQLSATLFPLDLYYRDAPPLQQAGGEQRNFDHPDALESELFIRHLRALAAGDAIRRPVYDFKTHSRLANSFTTVHPANFVVVEGIFALHHAELRSLYAVSVYVEAPHDVCLARRIHRDIRERGRTEACVRQQYESAVRPMADRYILPSRPHATLTVSGCESLDWSVESVMRELRHQGLLRN